MRFSFCRWVTCCCLLSNGPLFSAASTPSSPPVVTVLLNYEQPYSRLSFEALEHQLQRVLNDAGLKLDLRDHKETDPKEEFSELFIFDMRGHCSMDPIPVGALSDERGPLAMAYSAEGTILPFGEVECDHVRESIQRIVGRKNPRMYQQAFGSALGLVMAHEIYHMLARSAVHTNVGVTKPSLSAHELLDSRLSLPEAARLAIRQQLTQVH